MKLSCGAQKLKTLLSNASFFFMVGLQLVVVGYGYATFLSSASMFFLSPLLLAVFLG